MQVRLSKKLSILTKPSRYKVLHGGRGSGKSHGIATMLLVLGAKKPLRVLCTREIQRSIKDSVHRLLSDKIKALGLESFYTVLQTEIRGANGTLFLFAGLSDQTADSIKSFEGVDIAWCEEATTISKRSWDILTPTIRREDSEIWISMNPDLETDDSYKRFILSDSPDILRAELNWQDNPHWNQTLEIERLKYLKEDPDGYAHIWEGKTRSALEGAIYAKQIAGMMTDGRITNVPHDQSLKVHTAWDLGVGDATAIIFYQVVHSEKRIIDYYEATGEGLPHYASILQSKRYVYGQHFAPHDIRVRELGSGKSRFETAQNLGISFEITPNMALEDGIQAGRLVFGNLWIDKAKCDRLVECLRRYRWEENKQMGGFKSKPAHDEYSHGADAFRYFAINAQDEIIKRNMSNQHRVAGASWMN